LEFEGDVEPVFCKNFQLTVDSFGEDIHIDLKDDGANIPVTNENRQGMLIS
jgi:hypothetical protein